MMKKSREWLGTYNHLILGWFWILMIIPGVTIWKESLIFVILLSLYANIESSFAAYQAKKTDTSG